MAKATTLQVRSIMRESLGRNATIYTNKTTGDTSRNRRVKAYYNGDKKLVKKLQKLAGKDNVYILGEGVKNCYGRLIEASLIVKCKLAK
jgi:hypothetical protein